MHVGQRAELAQDYLQAVENLDLLQTNENQLAEISEQYTHYLFACKDAGMQYIQPGRFVLPTEIMKGAPIYQFFPLLNQTEADWQKLENSPKNSAYHTLKKTLSGLSRKNCETILSRLFFTI